MRKKFLVQIILAAAVAALGLTGCKNKTAMNGAGKSSNGESGVPPLGGGPDGGITSNGGRPVGMTGEPVKGQFGIVYFDYDGAHSPGEDAKLRRWPRTRSQIPASLVVEGYCDERGTAN
jgi:hypothetical protein